MGDCAAAIKEGYEIGALEKNDVYKIHAQCLTYNGKFVKLTGDGDFTRFELVPIKPEADGVYTYLFDQDGKLHTAKVANRFEIGTIHMTLAFHAGAKRVLASGELKKTGNRIEFNLISGTYMLKWMRDKLKSKCNDAIQAQTKQLFEAALPGMEIAYVGEDFITDANVPVTREQLNSYLDAGFEVRLYDDESVCRLNSAVLETQIAMWEKMKILGPHLDKAKADLERAKNYTLYARAGRRKTRRMKRRSTRRRRRV